MSPDQDLEVFFRCFLITKLDLLLLSIIIIAPFNAPIVREKDEEVDKGIFS